MIIITIKPIDSIIIVPCALIWYKFATADCYFILGFNSISNLLYVFQCGDDSHWESGVATTLCKKLCTIGPKTCRILHSRERYCCSIILCQNFRRWRRKGSHRSYNWAHVRPLQLRWSNFWYVPFYKLQFMFVLEYNNKWLNFC